MKKEKRWLFSAMIISTYIIYIVARTIYYLINKNSYGNVYFEFLFYPHLAFMLIGNVLNYILYFKDNKILKIAMIVIYIIGAAFLFITI